MSRNLRQKVLWATVASLFVAMLGTAVAEIAPEKRDRESKRVRPPSHFSDTDVFARDAKQRLSGSRPAASDGSTPVVAGGPSGGTPAPPTAGGGSWAAIIPGPIVEDEIKKFAVEIDAATANPGSFKSGGNLVVRKRFAVIALMFGIAHEFGEDIRWKDSAGGARDMFGRASSNAKASDINAFNDAKSRATELNDLIRGSKPDFPTPAEEIEWARLAERRPLMARLDDAAEKNIRKMVANEGEFSRNIDSIRHEAAVVAAIARIIRDESYEYADDDDYLQYCNDMQKYAAALYEAAERKNLEAAQTAIGELTKTCSGCHDGYR
ncbi:MAG: cytochrome c [Pirellulales bacterium]